MNRKILKTFYYNTERNIGDLLNVDLINYLISSENVTVSYSSKYECEFVAIGSILDFFNLEKISIKSIVRYLYYHTFSKPVCIWGTGLINNTKKFIPLRTLKIYALRGNLTKTLLEKSYNRKIKCVVADPGLLSNLLLNEKPKKKYNVGIIPHYTDKNNDIIINLYKTINNAILLDVKDEPLEFIRKIAECETVISTSLHGLIIADSLNIPNIWCKCSERLVGGDFKYYDYYSSFCINNIKPYDLRLNSTIDPDYIKTNYLINHEDVKIKQKELLNCFPYKHLKLKSKIHFVK